MSKPSSPRFLGLAALTLVGLLAILTLGGLLALPGTGGGEPPGPFSRTTWLIDQNLPTLTSGFQDWTLCQMGEKVGALPWSLHQLNWGPASLEGASGCGSYESGPSLSGDPFTVSTGSTAASLTDPASNTYCKGYDDPKRGRDGQPLTDEQAQATQAAIDLLRTVQQRSQADQLQAKKNEGKIDQEAGKSAARMSRASAVYDEGGRINVRPIEMHKVTDNKPGAKERLAALLVHELAHTNTPQHNEEEGYRLEINKLCELLPQAADAKAKREICDRIREANEIRRRMRMPAIACPGCEDYGGDGTGGSSSSPSPAPADFDPKYGAYLPTVNDSRYPEYYFVVADTDEGNTLFVSYFRPISDEPIEVGLGLDFYPTAITGAGVGTVYLAGIDNMNRTGIKRVRVILRGVPIFQMVETLLTTTLIQTAVDMDAELDSGETRLVLQDGLGAALWFFDLPTSTLTLFTSSVQVPPLINRRRIILSNHPSAADRTYTVEQRYAWEDFIGNDDEILTIRDVGNDGTVDSWEEYLGSDFILP